MEKTYVAIPSSDSSAVLNIEIFAPKDKSNLKGMIQICHGMTEHMDRYNEFAEYFTTNGYIVFGNDIISHGRSTTTKSECLYFSDWHNVVKDMVKTRIYVTKKYPHLNVYLLGFSLGSFIVRTNADLTYYKKTILVGTGYQPAVALKIMRKIVEIKSKRKMMISSDKIKQLVFDDYNKYFKEKPELYWLITDDNTRAEYENDPLVQRKFTPAFFCEFLKGMEYASANLKHPNNISPTLFLYGINDPVAGFGKGIRKIYTRYRAVNDQTEIESFPGTHDILHDEWREEVFKTIKEFLEK